MIRRPPLFSIWLALTAVGGIVVLEMAERMGGPSWRSWIWFAAFECGAALILALTRRNGGRGEPR